MAKGMLAGYKTGFRQKDIYTKSGRFKSYPS